MTDADTSAPSTTVPAVATPPAATPVTFVQPPEYANGMQLASAIAALLRADQGVMPDKVANQLMAFGGAGQDMNVQEQQVEALYDWACLAPDCPDDARRVGYGGASLFAKFSWGVMGKMVSADQPKRADGIRLELRRQMGDPSSTATQAERPAPQGVYVPAPVVKTITLTEDEVAELLGQLKTKGASDDVIEAAQAKLTPTDDATPQPAAT